MLGLFLGEYCLVALLGFWTQVGQKFAEQLLERRNNEQASTTSSFGEHNPRVTLDLRH